MTHWRNRFYNHETFYIDYIQYIYFYIGICCIVDGIVHFIWMRGRVDNYPRSVYETYRYQFLKEKHFATWSPCFPIHFDHLSTSFFFQSQNSVYIFPSRGLCPWRIIYILHACAYDLRLAPPPESTTAQALNAARGTRFSIVLIHAL